MKLKRYFAKEMRQAIRLVRDELGPDAVILSNQRKEGGVEIVAAVDFEQGLEQLTANQPVTVVEPPPRGQTPEEDFTYDARGKVEAGPPQEQAAGNDFERMLHRVSEKMERFASVPGAGDERPGEAASPSAPPNPSRRDEWWGNSAHADDPVITEMRSELRYLRGILENQLSGLAWGEMGRSCPQRVELLRRLLALGLSADHCRSVADRISDYTDPDQAWRQALNLLTGELRVTNDDILSEGGVVALVGPTGVGKTTTVAKLAARFALRHGYQEVALITTDSYRIAAYEQLRTYGRILGIPVRVVKNAEELGAALESFQHKRLVLIDTAGMGQRDVRLAEQFKTILAGAPRIKSYVLLAANVQGSGLNEVVRTFKHLKPEGCILTKLDECVSLGGALSVVVEQRLPVAYLSDGQRVPEDIQPARAEWLVERSAALLQESEESIDDDTMVLTMGGVSADAGI